MDIYSTGAIREVIRTIERPKPFLLDLFFRNQVNSTDEEILFDVELKKRRVAPMVAPHVPGKLVAQNGYRTERFAPAYVKDKRPLDPKRPLKRAIGEQIGGNPQLTPAQREAAILNQELMDQQDMLYRRLELMAADALDDGIVTVTGEGYPSVTVDFGRPAGHTISLSGSAEWDDAGISPIENVEDWSATFLTNAGVPVTDIVFDQKALRLFRKDPQFKDAVDTTLRGTTAQLDLTALPDFGGQLIGMYNSSTRLWLYANKYADDAGVDQNVLADYTVLLGNSSPEGAQTRAFGAIVDPEAGYVAEESFTKSWTEQDPGQRIIMMQSAPLTVLSRPGATFRARVKTS
jgi:hypothetical protein